MLLTLVLWFFLDFTLPGWRLEASKVIGGGAPEAHGTALSSGAIGAVTCRFAAGQRIRT